jgi:hypothetical protein
MHEVWAGDVLLTFDGRVLEIFGFPGQESFRFHVKNLDLSADGPDRKGRHMIKAKPATRGGGCAFEVGEDDWPQVGPFVDLVLGAMPTE